jgi:hypothetical protein
MKICYTVAQNDTKVRDKDFGTILSVVILIGSTIISTIKQLWKTHKDSDDNAN